MPTSCKGALNSPPVAKKKTVAPKTKASPKKLEVSQEEDAIDEAMTTYIQNIWEMYDADGNGVLDKDESKQFVQEMMSDLVSADHEEIDDASFEQIFAMLDTDGSGTIDKQEMFNYLKTVCKFNIETNFD